MQKKKALIIDDETDFRRLMRFYLSKKGFDCVYSHSLEEALVLVEQEQPEIICADRSVHPDLEGRLHAIINSSDDYDPDVYVYGPNR